jgi:hypothetical protein
MTMEKSMGIILDDFSKIYLHVGTIVEAEEFIEAKNTSFKPKIA